MPLQVLTLFWVFDSQKYKPLEDLLMQHSKLVFEGGGGWSWGFHISGSWSVSLGLHIVNVLGFTTKRYNILKNIVIGIIN